MNKTYMIRGNNSFVLFIFSPAFIKSALGEIFLGKCFLEYS